MSDEWTQIGMREREKYPMLDVYAVIGKLHTEVDQAKSSLAKLKSAIEEYTYYEDGFETNVYRCTGCHELSISKHKEDCPVSGVLKEVEDGA